MMIRNIDDELKDISSAAILGHVNPDGDCVGSTTALYIYIKKYFPEVDVRLFLAGYKDEFDHINVLDQSISEDDPTFDPDVTFILDVSSYDRIGTAPELLKRAKKTVCIDHHMSNEGLCDVDHIVPDASSCAEVLFDIMSYDKITNDIAISLYTGIIHDSGVFQYKNTTPHTMEIGAKLIAVGIPFNEIIDDSFYSRSFKESRIIGYALEKAELYFDDRCIYTEVDFDTMNSYGVSSKDMAAIVSQIRLVKGIEIAVFNYPGVQGGVKVSMRSAGDIDVCEIASVFGGGGHLRAAGCTITEDFTVAKEKILEEVGKRLK